MNPSLFLLAPLALLVPAPAGAPAVPDGAGLTPVAPSAPVSVGDSLAPLDPAAEPVANQVRIEQRVTIRIAPAPPAMRSSMMADMAPPDSPPRLVERKMGKCVPVSGIAAVQPQAGGRLLLYMRDQRLVSAELEKACSARDFYSGFYIDPSRDGMLCSDRDKLHSRTGAICQLGRMRQLVYARD